MNRKEQLILKYSDHTMSDKHYEVVQVINSTHFSPGQFLTKSEVDERIRKGWTVKVK